MAKILKRPPIIIAFAIAFVAVAFSYTDYLESPDAGYDHVVKLTSNRRAYDFADCLVQQQEGHPEKSMHYLWRSVYQGPPKGDVALRSQDQSIFVNINSGILSAEKISIIVRFQSVKESQAIELIRKCL